MGVASGCGEQEAGVASGSGWNLWVWLLGVVVRRSRIWNRWQNYFSENFYISKLSHIGDVKDGSISVLQEDGWKLSRDQAT